MEFISKVRFYLLTAFAIIIIMAILFHKPLTGEYNFSGIYSLSPKAINQGIILLCTKDKFFQRFIVEGDRLKEYENKFFQRVEQYYSIINSKKSYWHINLDMI